MTVSVPVRAHAAVKLSAHDCERLELFAPWFDIHFTRLPDDQVELRVLDNRATVARVETIPASKLHRRLLAELCSKTLRWIYYHPGEPCSVSLLRNTDARMKRIAHLYERWKADGFPE